MSMFDGLFGNLEEMAGKFGLPTDQIQAMMESFQGKMGGGTDMMTAMMQAAQEHGLSLDKIQEMMGGAGAQDMMAKAQDMFSQMGKDSPFGDLGGMLKGFLGKE